MNISNDTILTNILKIRADKRLTQAAVAESINIDDSSYSKLESGQTKLTIDRLAEIARAFNMSVIDVITYPQKFAPLDYSSKEYKSKVILQIELEEDKREQVLKVVFGENNIEILNK